MQNKVELIGIYGGDLTHALSAWTSTSRDLTDEKRARVGKLLEMLARDGHGTPFEKSSIHFLCKVDIVTHYQMLKHRVAVSINTESARYKEIKEDAFYVPNDWTPEEQQEYIVWVEDALRRYHQMIVRLKARGVPAKRAKETARYYFPLGKQLVLDVMFNFRSFMHFVGLRKPDSAQGEIRVVTDEMLQLVRNTHEFDLSLKAFGH
jgi:thymidylate synthase (FAD)